MLLVTSAVRADYVHDGDVERWGRVVTAIGSDVVFDVACDAGRRVTLKKAQVIRMEFNADCKARQMPRYASGVEDCEKPFKGYIAMIDGLPNKPFVEDFDIGTGPRVSLRTHDGTLLIVDRPKLRSLAVALKCKLADASDQPNGPVAEGVCFEPRQWAVAYTGNPVSRNELFTKGFTVYVAGLGEPGSGVVDVRQSFGHALTMWMSALLRIRAELEPELKTFVEQSFQCGAGGACLLTPPQVVRRYCQPTAMFLLRWVERKGDGFGQDEQAVLAKAQVEGRTLLINAADHRFDVRLGGPPRLGGERYNLISILTHELGHAFGLPDWYDGQPSIMSASVRGMSEEPTNDDARRLAQVLLREIKGSPPGEINLASCAGLRAD